MPALHPTRTTSRTPLNQLTPSARSAPVADEAPDGHRPRSGRAASIGVLLLLGLTVACGQPPAGEGAPPDMAMPVIAAKVAREALEERLPLIGSLRAREEVRLISEVDARIERIGFDEGTLVTAGTVLFEFDSRRQAARLADGEARHALALSELNRGRELLERRTIPPQEFDRLQAAYLSAEAELSQLRADLEDTSVVAPFDGVMTSRMTSVGQFITRGTELAGLIQMDPLEVEFQVPERFVSQIREGQRIRMRTVAFGDEDFEGVVDYVAPRIDPQSRSLEVKASMANSDGRLRPGQFGTIDLVFRSREDALVIPETAVRYQAGDVFVTMVDDERRVSFQPVTAGMRLEGRIEILDGLQEGDVIVIEGFQKVGPGSKVLFAAGSADHGVEPDPADAGAPAAEEPAAAAQAGEPDEPGAAEPAPDAATE